MIKINLLPKTINQKVILRNTAIGFGAALLAIIVGGVLWGSNIQAQADAKRQEADVAEAFKAKVDGIKKQGQELKASVEPLQKKLDFINKVLEYNRKYPALYAEIAGWTYKNVEYTAMLPKSDQVTIKGRAKNLDEFGRYLLNLYRATELFSEVTVTTAGSLTEGGNAGSPSGPPAGRAGGQIGQGENQVMGIGYHWDWIPFTVVCKLHPNKVITPPTFEGAAATGTGDQSGDQETAEPVWPGVGKQ